MGYPFQVINNMAATTASTSFNQAAVAQVVQCRVSISEIYGEIEALRAMLARDPGLLNSMNDQQQRAVCKNKIINLTQCVEFLLSVDVNVSSQIVCDIPS
ncbi:hypothetical protein Pelo_6821 [Pelomyxa schiedti]|nr:hypothetical protein Pelo_6821 [Pelomyxa schiedti]